MQSQKILLNTITKIKEMQLVLQEYDIDADIKHDLIVVDAQSFMGVVSLDLTKPVTLLLYTDDKSLAQTIFERLGDLCV